MFIRFWQWIKPPVFEQEDKSRIAVWLHLILLSIALSAFFICIISFFLPPNPVTIFVAALVFIVAVVALAFNRYGMISPATLILLFALLGIATYTLYTSNGIHDTSILFYPTLIIIGGLLLKRRAYVALVLLIVSSVGFIVFAESNGWIVTKFGTITDYGDFIVVSAILVVQAITIALLMGGYFRSLRRAQLNAQATAESAQTLRALLNSSTDPMLLIDTDGHILDLNEALASTIGRPMTELAGMRIFDLTSPETARQRKKVIDEVIRNGQPIQTEDHYPDAWFENNMVPILDKHGKVYRVAIYVRNVTPYKKAEEEIRILNAELEKRVVERTAQLEAANKELESFSYTVSHDLRAPLRAINGFAKILEDDFGAGFAPPAQNLLKSIRAAGAKISLLIDDLLDFSRLGRKPLNKEMVDTKMLVQSVIETFAPETAHRHIDWVVGELPPCRADGILLQQVYANLIGNAVKYSGKRDCARIEIASFAQNGETIYFVRDNGAGFDMRYVDKLFGVFQRLHHDSEFEGTGIGLATVKRIIERHGGRIWCEAEVDKGATFYFTLGVET